jgi:hypothetical protein
MEFGGICVPKSDDLVFFLPRVQRSIPGWRTSCFLSFLPCFWKGAEGADGAGGDCDIIQVCLDGPEHVSVTFYPMALFSWKYYLCVKLYIFTHILLCDIALVV